MTKRKHSIQKSKSFNEILSIKKEKLAGKIFSVELPETHMSDACTAFVQIKMTKYHQDGVESTMLQLIDMSTAVKAD